MKKSILFLPVYLFCFSMIGLAQIKVANNKACNFLRNLPFKNGTYTVIVKATFKGLFRSPDYITLKDLEKAKKLKYKEFGVDTGEVENTSSISFVPERCTHLYSGPLIRKTFYTSSNNTFKLDLNTLAEGKVIYLTCVVFEDRKYRYADGTPFFVVINVFTEKPTGF